MFQILQNGLNIALVTDAGTPSISDPGSYTVSKLIKNGVVVSPIPGPSAVSCLASVAGIPADNYIFGGFFPRKEMQAIEMLKKMTAVSMPLIFFESPKRIKQTLECINDNFKGAYCIVGKELTKIYETIFYGSPEEILATFTDDMLKGEWCFMVSLPKEKTAYNPDFLNQACELGLSQSQIGSLVKTLGWNKKDVYNYVINYKKDH